MNSKKTKTSETTLTMTAVDEAAHVVDFMHKMYDHVNRAEVAASSWFQGRSEMRAILASRGGTRIDADTRWTKSVHAKALVSDNRWEMEQAQMYGIVTLVEQNDEIIKLLRTIASELHDPRNGM